MNTRAMIDYLTKQSKFCQERAQDDIRYFYLADIYAVLAQTLLIGTTPSAHDFPPQDGSNG